MNIKNVTRVFKNPDSFFIFLKTGNKDIARNSLHISESRKKMIHACELADSYLEKNYSVVEIIEKISKKLGMTKYPIAWYCLVRKHRPKIIVETGTSMGWSSFMILQAITKNKHGSLYSFDLDDSINVKNAGGVGYLVPKNFSKNWTLIIGDTKIKLEPLLVKLEQIDMFIHDSEHSYEMMNFEYSLAWKYLKPTGILCSDDINHSKSFDEFIQNQTNDITDVVTFQEISRSTDSQHLRPYVGYFFKK